MVIKYLAGICQHRKYSMCKLLKIQTTSTARSKFYNLFPLLLIVLINNFIIPEVFTPDVWDLQFAAPFLSQV